MNLEEALDIIDTDPCYIGLPESRKGVSYDDYFEAKGLVMEAAEKQLPKKPIESEFDPLICSDCEAKVILGQKYCINCGQKIDWEVQDELY